jgi:DNA-binding XRE family transcriptional regulator
MKPESPKPWDIRSARHKTGFTMQEAADLVYVSRQTWLNWERNPDHPQHSEMHPAYAELFALKTGLKPLPDILARLKKESA